MWHACPMLCVVAVPGPWSQSSAEALLAGHLDCLGSGLNMMRLSLVCSGVLVNGDVQPTQWNKRLLNAVVRGEHIGSTFS